ncbi:MAG: hypothetical protein Q9226_005366 [Calogaya cf. arnoldii]
MQVWLRDIAVLGLSIGMRFTSRYAQDPNSGLSMVGSAGYITSSKHPILGTILHFAPSNVKDAWYGFGAGSWGIEKLWVLRMKGFIPIAGKAYDQREMDYLSELDPEWLPADDGDFRPQTRRNYYGLKKTTPPEQYHERSNYPKKPTSKRGSASSFVNLPVSPSSLSTQSRNSEKVGGHDLDTAQEAKGAEVVLRRARGPVRQRKFTPELKGEDGNSEDHLSAKRHQNGDEDMDVFPEPLMITSGSGQYGQDFDRRRRHEQDLVNAEENANGVLHSPSHASMVNMELTRTRTHEGSQSHTIQSEGQVENDKRTQPQSTAPRYDASTTPPSPVEHRRLSSDDYEPEKPDSTHQASNKESTTQSQQAKQDAQRQKRIHDRGRKRRAQRNGKENSPYKIVPSPVDWRWLSQMDIIPNYWATPWSSESDGRTSEGAISAVLEALSDHADARTLQYISRDERLEPFSQWAEDGKSTWPIYATNARGGVAVHEDSTKVEFPGFTSKMPAVRLLLSYRWQTEHYTKPKRPEETIAELMMLDSWLSMCGRQPEITDGASNLLRNMPKLIQFLFEEFGEGFGNLDRTANEGGLQQIRTVALSLSETLGDEKFSQAEQLFTLVALLRTAKVDLSITDGPETWQVYDALETNTRVWLV